MTATDSEMIRGFVAIELPNHVKAVLAETQNALKNHGILASWPKPAAMHLTLKFLGDIPMDQIPTVKEITRAAGELVAPFSLHVSAIGVFPGVKKAKVAWCGLGGQTEKLVTIVSKLDESFSSKFGIKKSKRYTPHMTLARIKKPLHPKKAVRLLQRFSKVSSKKFKVREIHFYKSILNPNGAVHEKIFSVCL